jgi:hypothetical protein
LVRIGEIIANIEKGGNTENIFYVAASTKLTVVYHLI